MWNLLISILISSFYLRPTIINVFTPLVYNYVSDDTAYLVSMDGFLYPVVWHKDTLTGSLSFLLLDSLELGIKGINTASFSNDTLILGATSGIFSYVHGNLRKLSNLSPDFIFYRGGKIYALSKNYLEILPDSVRFPLKGSYVYSTRNGDFFVTGKGKLYYFKKGKPAVEKSFDSYKCFCWDEERKYYPFLKVNPAAEGDSGVLSFIGYKHDESLLAYIDERKLQLKTIKVAGLVSNIFYNQGKFWVFYEKNYITHLNLFDENTLTVRDSYRFTAPITSVVNFYDGYWFIITALGFSYLFKDTYTGRFYNHMLSSHPEKVYSSPLLYDFDKDGDNDLMFIVTSTTSDIDLHHKAWGVVFFENTIPHHLEAAFRRYNYAQKHNNFLKCGEALKQIDLALETFNVLMPESLSNALKLRESIYQTVVLRGKLKQILSKTFYFFLFVILPVSIIILLYSRYQKEKELTRTVPSSYSIGLLLSMDIFHKFSSKWFPITQKSAISDDELNELLTEIEEIINLLSIPRIKYEFKESKKEWRQIYSSLMSNLTQLRYILKLHKKLPFLRNICMRVLKSKIIEIGELRKEFKRLSESVKEDIVTNAILPIVEKFQKKLSGSDIQIKTDIKTEIPFLYYPDEIRELKTALETILDNAVESFENFTPAAPPTITVKVRSSVSELLIEITDNGRGIPEEVLPRVFEEGFSFGKGGGRGMGLSSARKIIEKYGEIKIISSPEKGTKVIIKLIFGKREVQS